MNEEETEQALGNASVFLISCWRVYTNSDRTEGRGSPVTLAYFKHRRDADAFAVGKGAYNTPAQVERLQVTVVFLDKNAFVVESPAPYFSGPTEDESSIRERALAKLTEQERVVLGLQ